ncbi:BrxE family protein [Haloplanus natans]|uniref:BrxE family protein n=1 Tax=Haloplanus natans TaxID=376171 RepID=UPI000677B51A|nr:BrxE family protein [Haloplanus natans]
MASTDVVEAFTSTKKILYECGLTDDFFLDLVASRLLIERIGETNNQGWWESRILSETGRIRLSEVAPKTRLKSQIDLALKVGRKAESDRLPEDSISLFSFGPQMESRLTAAIDEIEADENVSFEELENLTVSTLEEGWTDPVIEQTEANISGEAGSHSLPESDAGDTILVDEDGYTQDKIDLEKWRLLVAFLRGYGRCTNSLQVAYYPLESEVKPENA